MRHSSGVLMVGSPKIEKNAVNYILPCTSLISGIRESSMNVIFTGPSTSEVPYTGNDFYDTLAGCAGEARRTAGGVCKHDVYPVLGEMGVKLMFGGLFLTPGGLEKTFFPKMNSVMTSLGCMRTGTPMLGEIRGQQILGVI